MPSTTMHMAYTERINPEGASPVLTREQIWKGLQRKIRHAEDFVPVIIGCKVLEEKGNEVIREAQFQEMNGQPGRTVREVCKSYYPTRVDFWQENGAVITNTISDGDGMTERNLHMTYTFEWRIDGVEEGSEEHKERYKTMLESSKMAVHSSIVAMRKMAEAGELD